MIKDITKDVEWGDNDGESLPILKCICGQEFDGWGDFTISVYRDKPDECPSCGRKLFFSIQIKVYEVTE